jgi:NADPH:quinone reductase-like Zn-dependent oxidoreductase
LTALGAEPLLDVPSLGEQTERLAPQGVDGMLELIGNRSLLDSLTLVRYGGHVVMAGFLGGPEPIATFDPLFHLPSGVSLSFFASAFMFGTAALPMRSIPFQSFIDAVQGGRFQASPAHVFPFAELVQAHELMDSGQARGKIVISMEDGQRS